MNTTENKKTTTPEVGMGATIYAGSDSYPATVSRVSPSGKTIWVKKDKKMVTGGTFEEGNVTFVTLPDEEAEERQYSLRSNGYWLAKGTPLHARYGHLSLGARSYHQDPSF
jgi:hypothetical protein